MTELRRDRIVGRWVIVEKDEDSSGPDSYDKEDHSRTHQAICQFCPGRENQTTPEVEAIRPNGSEANTPGWTARVCWRRTTSVPRRSAPPWTWRSPTWPQSPASTCTASPFEQCGGGLSVGRLLSRVRIHPRLRSFLVRRRRRLALRGRHRGSRGMRRELGERIQQAEQMVRAGAASLLIEGTAAEVAEIITKRSEIPVISCGSGPGCDGQILIAPDILGLTTGTSPKFAKSYSNLADDIIKAFNKYNKEIESGTFPDQAHSYHMKAGETERLKELLKIKH